MNNTNIEGSAQPPNIHNTVNVKMSVQYIFLGISRSDSDVRKFDVSENY